MDTLRADLVGSLEEEVDLVLESLAEDEVHSAAGYCVVGRFLTDQMINFTAMKNRMADIWKLVKGVTIRTLGNGRFMFEFYHPLDVSRVMDGLPWTFNNHPLLLHHLQRGGTCYEGAFNNSPILGSVRCKWGEVARGWDASLCASERCGMMGTGSRWLRGGAGQEMGSVGGDVKVTPTIPMQGGQGSGTKPVQGKEGNISK
ncbi:hypothetical protein ACS0TY_013958 [Phlomoides rotata]